MALKPKKKKNVYKTHEKKLKKKIYIYKLKIGYHDHLGITIIETLKYCFGPTVDIVFA